MRKNSRKTQKLETILTPSVITSGQLGKYFVNGLEIDAAPSFYLCLQNFLFPLQTDLVFLNEISKHMLHTSTMRTSLDGTRNHETGCVTPAHIFHFTRLAQPLSPRVGFAAAA